MLAERIWRAHEQGLINGTDRDLRLQNVQHAHSMTELDLMARLAGLELEDRWDWYDKRPFTDQSGHHVSVYRKPN